MEFPKRPDYSNVPPIRFTPDSRAVAMKKIEDAYHALGVIYGEAKKDDAESIDFGLATNCVKVAEFNLADLCKTLGVETDSSNEREDRSRALRAANMRCRELEAKIGGEQSPESVQHALKSMHDHINKWWDLEGFGHISSIDFDAYGCDVDFSCNLFGSFNHWDDPKPVTNKSRKAAWIDSLRERGFSLTQDDREWSIEDCDSSRQVLIDLFALRLPTARVVSFENVHRYNHRGFIIRGVKVRLYNIGEIASLPIPPEKKEAA